MGQAHTEGNNGVYSSKQPVSLALHSWSIHVTEEGEGMGEGEGEADMATAKRETF